MLGAIAGDIIGSIYEFDKKKPEYDFQLFHKYSHFTDDTVLTVALADSILFETPYIDKVIEYYHLYPDAGYGGMFRQWAANNGRHPYNSFGNGSAMRVSPVGWAYNDLDTVLQKAKESAEITHNHPEGIKGAQATASAIFLARQKTSKAEIKDFITENFNYNLDFELEELREHYRFNETCQGTVPQAIYTFFISKTFEDSIRKAIYIGGDSDTLACINGSIAEAYYGIPAYILEQIYKKLDNRLTQKTKQFVKKYINHR
ncbi:ADP-ribosylglycohydrolase family protein [Ignavibacterium sp.]|uniref:ADP-ribosylglycohydrolase family protein n=2 Tax=Ignavibacterium sp. TaxID=2651167 RepID=UPI00307F314C